MKDWGAQSVLGIEAPRGIAPLAPEPLAPPAPLVTRGQPEGSLSGLLPYGSAAPEVLLNRCFQELVRFYRHSSCGRLCRGIVHRLNTPLQVLFFQVELLEKKSQEELRILAEVQPAAGNQLQTLHRYRLQKVRQLHQELEKIQALVQTLVLEGGHEDAEERLPLNLNEIYRRELELYQSRPFFRHRVEQRFYFQEGLPPLNGHYIDFSQSFRNLLENALEAMADSPHPRLTVATAWEDGQLLLYLGDTGPGVHPKIMPRIFEPFFTTKQDGENGHAGLGLFMARRLLAPYRGEIKLNSIPGETWVTVALPVQ